MVEAADAAGGVEPAHRVDNRRLRQSERAAVQFGGRPSPNLFVAGEMMAGNVLGKGYTAGVGMTIGTVFGRIAGASAAAAVRAAPGALHAAA